MEPKNFKFLLWAPAIVGVALFLGLWILGVQIKESRSGDTITVTGSTKRKVWSDNAKWEGTFTQLADLNNVPAILQNVATQAATIKGYMMEQGLEDSRVRVDAAVTEPTYEQLPNYGQSNRIIGYTIRQTIAVDSLDVDRIEKLSKTITAALAAKSIVFNYQSTEYSYSKLADLRPELFSEATKDAQVRAQAIAKGTGVTVGKLRSARTGVIQVLKPDSTDVSDYGTYDLSTKEKEINAVVTVSFDLGN